MHVFPNGKKYFGLTSKAPDLRWKNGHGYTNQRLVFSAIIKYGWNNITHIVLLSGLDRPTAEQAEIFLIENNKTADRAHGYNIALGGTEWAPESRDKARRKLVGQKRSAEFCKRCRESQLGRKASPELRAKLSIAHMGRKLSAENVENLRRINTGKKRSDETRKKMSDNKRKFYKDPKNRAKTAATAVGRKRPVVQMSLSGDEVHRYESLKKAAAAMGCCRASIINATRVRKDGITYGRIAQGFKWRYA
jgi:group I intron endonuclease